MATHDSLSPITANEPMTITVTHDRPPPKIAKETITLTVINFLLHGQIVQTYELRRDIYSMLRMLYNSEYLVRTFDHDVAINLRKVLRVIPDHELYESCDIKLKHGHGLDIDFMDTLYNFLMITHYYTACESYTELGKSHQKRDSDAWCEIYEYMKSRCLESL